MFIKQIVLASQSEIRRKILESSGLPFVTIKSDVDETLINFKDPRVLAFKRAEAKSIAVAKQEFSSLVIGCDQTLSCEGQKLTKPKTSDQAIKHIEFLSGKKHILHSAIFLSVVSGEQVLPLEEFSFVTDCELYMRSLSKEEIANYVSLNQWKGCVGAYRIEESGIHLFEERSDQNFTGIMGLPLMPLLSRIRNLGINLFLNTQGPWTLNLESKEAL